MDLGKSPLQAREGSSRRSGTLKELCFDDKQKVANIIKQVVSLKEDADRNQKIRKEEHLDFQRRLKEMNDRNKEVIRENASLKSKLLQALAMVRTYQHKVRAIEVSQRLKQSNEITDQISMPKLPPSRSSTKKTANSQDSGLEVIIEGGQDVGELTQSAETACQTSPGIQPEKASDSKMLLSNKPGDVKDVTGGGNAEKSDSERRMNAAVQTDCADGTERMTKATNVEFDQRSVISDGTASDATLSGFSSELAKCSMESECESDATSLLGDIIKKRLKQKKALAATSNRSTGDGGESSDSIASQTVNRAPREKRVDVKMPKSDSSISDGSLGCDIDVEASKPMISFDPGAGPKGSFFLKPGVCDMDEKIHSEGRGDVCTERISQSQHSSLPPEVEDGRKRNEESDQKKGVPLLLTSPVKDSLPTGSTSDIHVHHHVHISPSPPPPSSGMQVRHIGDHADDQKGSGPHGIASQKESQFDASLMDLVSEVEDLLDKGHTTHRQMSRRMDAPSYHHFAPPGGAFVDETELIQALLLQDM
ncbi:hypothetical protein BSKO_01524 [Bryopsis sp. KO-2023]|nr:hypothetical protein BSKO_01524 [Bryopsis sp. KO-2023]